MRAQARYRWLYLLVLFPTISDLIETGAWPATRRAWLTEIAIGIVILALVRHLRSVHAQLMALTATDPLTGLRNRRGFVETVDAHCARSSRGLVPLSLVCIDLDNFKLLNDSAGHAVGDQVLRQLGAAIVGAIRADIDHAFRLGGDEFAILLPGVNAAGSERLLDRIRSVCRTVDTAWANGALQISAGIVEHQPPESSMALLRRADVAMYQVKKQRKFPPAGPVMTPDDAPLPERIRA